jgi:hypothetical protein
MPPPGSNLMLATNNNVNTASISAARRSDAEYMAVAM